MSLLSGTSGGGIMGDIWSTGAFASYSSPLKDLLDSDNYTTEQLLAEDELLQEIRGLHPKLIRLFTTEEAVSKLIEYIILPPPTQDPDKKATAAAATEYEAAATAAAANTTSTTAPGNENTVINGINNSNMFGNQMKPQQWLTLMQRKQHANKKISKAMDDAEMRHIRFPYMACEVICCEISGIINLIVDGNMFEDSNQNSLGTAATAGSTSHTAASDGLGTSSSVDSQKTSEKDPMEIDPQNTIISQESSEEGPSFEIQATHNAASQAAATKPRILDLFFSLLVNTPVGHLDDYRAGYFEKILRILYKKRPDEMVKYVNSGGRFGRVPLIQALLKHLYSHSIMQIAQRLLLPQRPVAKKTESQDDDEEANGTTLVDGDDLDNGEIKSDWSQSGEAINMLLDSLIGPDPVNRDNSKVERLSDAEQERRLDLSLNASEVLISIIQNSMLSSKTMLSLTSTASLKRLIEAATTLRPEFRSDYFSPHESLLTSAMMVLESIILQLGGYGAVGTMSLLSPQQEQEAQAAAALLAAAAEDPILATRLDDMDEVEVSPVNSQDEDDTATTERSKTDPSTGPLIADLTALLEELPILLYNLSQLLLHPSTEEWRSPTQYSKGEPQPMLGSSRLRIVRVLESLVLLGDPDVDAILVQSDCLEICLNLFWDFQWCSMLHQSVANLLVHVFEGRNARVEMQEYFLIRCNILVRLMDSFVEADTSINTNMNNVCGAGNPTTEGVFSRVTDVVPEQRRMGDDDNLPVSEDDVDAAMEKQSEELIKKESSNNSVGQVSTEAVQYESRDGSTVGLGAPAQSFRFGYMGHVIIICQALVHACTRDEEEDQITENGRQESEQSIADSNISEKEPLFLAEMVAAHPLTARWREFVASTLATESAMQSTPLGGYNAALNNMNNNDPLHSHRPGLADDPDLDSVEPPLPPRGMLAGGELIDMDDNDLDVAASMMAGLSMDRPSGTDGDEDERSGGGDSDKSVNSGETNDSGGYLFDDPLGKVNGGLGIDLGKLTQYNPELDNLDQLKDDSNGDDDSDKSSSDEEPESKSEVPVMDLFAGNFDYGDDDDQERATGGSDSNLETPDWSNFANFEEAPFEEVGFPQEDEFGSFQSASDPEPTPEDDVPLVRPAVGIEDLLGGDEPSPKTVDSASATTSESVVQVGGVSVDEDKKYDEEHVEDQRENTIKSTVEACVVTPEHDNVTDSYYFRDEILSAPSDELNADFVPSPQKAAAIECAGGTGCQSAEGTTGEGSIDEVAVETR